MELVVPVCRVKSRDFLLLAGDIRWHRAGDSLIKMHECLDFLAGVYAELLFQELLQRRTLKGFKSRNSARVEPDWNSSTPVLVPLPSAARHHPNAPEPSGLSEVGALSIRFLRENRWKIGGSGLFKCFKRKPFEEFLVI